MHKGVWCQIAELSIVTRRILIILLIKIILMPIILSELKSKKISDFLIRRNLFNFHISPCITFPPVNWLSSVQFSHWIVSDSLQPMNSTMSGLPVHHQLLEFTQTHVHWVGDTIQTSHSVSSPSPPALNLSSISVFSNESVLPIR